MSRCPVCFVAHEGSCVPAAVPELRQPHEYEKTPDPIGTIAHLMTTVNFNMAHARRHMASAVNAKGTERQFHIEHAHKHLNEAADHADHLTQAISSHDPRIAAEYERVMKQSVNPSEDLE